MGDAGSADYTKTFVVGIPFPSSGCGRIANFIYFSDKQSGSMVGQVREYGIRAVVKTSAAGTALAVSNMTTMPYRIPFLVQVGGTVTTVSGSGMANVSVCVCCRYTWKVVNT